jgi:hypothetical protein
LKMMLACQKLVKRAGAEDSDLTWMVTSCGGGGQAQAMRSGFNYTHVRRMLHAPGVNR